MYKGMYERQYGGEYTEEFVEQRERRAAMGDRNAPAE